MSGSQYDVTAYGATGDGRDTEAVQAALDECAETGGTVRVPPGEYRTGPLEVGDDTTLHLDRGATLHFARDVAAFLAVESHWEGRDRTGFHPCLWIHEASGVAVCGGGTIDGEGSYWWPMVDDPGRRPEGLAERLEEMRAGYERDDVSAFTLRPPLLQVFRLETVTVEGVTLANSPFWNAHVAYSEDVTTGTSGS